MRPQFDWVRVFYQPFARRSARRVMTGRIRKRGSPESGRFTRGDVDELMKAAWQSYDTRASGLPKQPTRGSTMNLRLACFTLAVLDALVAIGIEREYAIELVADATWSVYQVWAGLASLTSRFSPRKSTALAFAATPTGDPNGAVSLRFPFNAPGYLIEPVAVTQGVGFDVVHCPVGSYFRKHGAADVCLATWCNLDYALGEMTGGKLVRTKTIVQGSDRCDFRIVPVKPTLST